MELGESQIDNGNDNVPEGPFVGSQEPSSDFDNVVGHLEEIIMSNHFQSIQDQFMNENYDEFDENEENKFCYTEIHEKYINTVERMLEEQLCQRIPHFSMRSFIDNLVSNSNCLDGEIFEMLYTFTDFLAFKEMMIDYKKAKTGQTVNLELINSYHHYNHSSIIMNDTIDPYNTDPIVQ
uniref:ADP-ribosylation factor-like protein 2-binding protein n=1 Tax=Schistosoma mansoni TaxID=6183 RepID=A0A3Q0KKJ5_SCHMA